MLLSLFLRLYTYCHGTSYYHAGIRGKETESCMHDEPQTRMIHECVTLTSVDKTDTGAQWFCGADKNICFT